MSFCLVQTGNWVTSMSHMMGRVWSEKKGQALSDLSTVRSVDIFFQNISVLVDKNLRFWDGKGLRFGFSWFGSGQKNFFASETT